MMLLVLNLSCGGNSTSSSGVSYSGPGSNYSLTVNEVGGSFSLTESDAGWTVTGEFEELNSGFGKLTTTTQTVIAGSPPAVNSVHYVFLVPGLTAMLQLSGSTQLTPTIIAGSCPTDNFEGNWLFLNVDAAYDITTQDTFGTFSSNYATGAASLPTKYMVDGTVFGSASSLGIFTCSNGVGTVDTARMYMTDGGAIVNTDVNTAANSQFIVALEKKAISNITGLDGSYIGFVNTASGTALYSVTATVTAGVIAITSINPETEAADGNISTSMTMANINTPSDGFMTGTFGSSAAACMGVQGINSSTKNFIMCGAPDPGTATAIYNVVLISR